MKTPFAYYNPNPAGIHTGDCAYRGISAFFGITWMQSVLELVLHAANKGLVNFTYITNITSYMKAKGYDRKKPQKEMTVREFIDTVAISGHTYMIATKQPRHITIVNPNKELTDIANCFGCIVKYYWER